MRDDINRLRASVDSYLEREAWDDALDDLQVLWRLQPTQATAGFIAARGKRLAPHLRGTPLKVRFLRSFTVEPALPLLRAGALVLGIDLEPVVADFGIWAQEILDPQSPTYSSNPNVVILALQTRDIAPELWSRGPVVPAEALAAARTRVVDEFRSYLTSFRSRSQAQLIVHGLECLPVARTGILDHQGPSGQIETTQLINHDLIRLCKEQGAYFLDYDGLVARYGRRLWLDERRWLDARLPIASGALPTLADEWLRFLCPIAGRSAKCLVCDLDNTLWGGVVGEDGYDGIKLDGEYPGAAFQALQRAILDIADRGVILAIASKNNPEDALHVLRDHPGMLLRPDHFAAMRINWSPKGQNLREIAKELNIGVDSLVFLDDNPVERGHVRHEVPEVTVLELPEDPMGYADTLRACPLFERLRLSAEDRERGQYYANQRQRSELQATMGSPDDYLRKLETVATVGRADDLSIPRIAQLTRKTNQFNLSTHRYSDEEVAALAASPDAGVYWLKVTDRFGDNGIVGAAILKFRDGKSELDTFLLSCRVIGRTVETAFLSRLLEEARSHKAGVAMTAWFLPTAKNEPVRDFLPKHDFRLIEETPAGSHWELGADQTVRCPEWIKMTNP